MQYRIVVLDVDGDQVEERIVDGSELFTQGVIGRLLITYQHQIDACGYMIAVEKWEEVKPKRITPPGVPEDAEYYTIPGENDFVWVYGDREYPMCVYGCGASYKLLRTTIDAAIRLGSWVPEKKEG